MTPIRTQLRYARFAPQVGLLVLLFAEILYLTISFDTQYLDNVSASWARLIGWTPQYLRVTISAMALAIAISGGQMWIGIRGGDLDADRFRPHYLAAHLGAFALFAWVTAILMGSDFSSNPHPGRWALVWVLAGGTTIIAWGLAALPLETWLVVLRRGRAGLCWGLGAGVAVWAGGVFLTQEFWKPLARYTFNVVAWILRGIYVDIVSDRARFLLGTPSFTVDIAPECAGYEGIGLILAFLSIYLWLSRKHLRFPRALILLPVGAAAIWFLNAVRIAALIVIGSSGWPDVALGGFHSQAGWLSFNAVGLGLVAISVRGRYFTVMTPAEASVVDGGPTAAYLVPFLAIVATSMLTGAFSSGFDWLYPARVIAAAAALWTFREYYADLSWKWSWRAIAIGAVAFVIWLALMPTGVHDNDGWPGALRAIPSRWAALWLAFRAVGYVVTVPLAEELAFRGFLPRRLVQADFYNLPVAKLLWLPVLISSLLFGALHGQFWLAGTIAGLLFAAALYRGKALGDAVQAHATTNGLMVLYVFATGHWSAWS